MKKVFGILTVLAVLGFSLNANAAWVTHSSAKYKISFSTPTGMKLAAKDFGKWGALVGKQGPIRVEMYGYMGVASDADVMKFGIARTGIPAKYWKADGAGTNWNGFTKWEKYYVTDGKWVLGAALLRTASRTYLVFVATPVAVYVKYKADFKAFGNSFKAL